MLSKQIDPNLRSMTTTTSTTSSTTASTATDSFSTLLAALSSSSQTEFQFNEFYDDDEQHPSLRWLAKTCQHLRGGSWPVRQPISLDGAIFDDRSSSLSSLSKSSTINKQEAIHFFFEVIKQQQQQQQQKRPRGATGNFFETLNLRNVCLDDTLMEDLKDILQCTNNDNNDKENNINNHHNNGGCIIKGGYVKKLNLCHVTSRTSSTSSSSKLLCDNEDDDDDDDDDSCCSDVLYDTIFQHCFHLHELKIEKCSIYPTTVPIMIQKLISFGSLTTLKLYKINLECTDKYDMFEQYGTKTTTTLQHFEIREPTHFHHDGINKMLHSLTKYHSLQSLVLEGCNIGYSNIYQLSKLLTDHSGLKSIDLTNNNLDGTCIKILADSLSILNLREGKEKSVLSKLVLSQNPIGNDGAKHIANMLCTNRTIESLTLLDCEIWSEGCISLARGLSSMCGLKQLIVDGSEWEDHVDIVLEALECKNMTLLQLWTSRSPILMYKDSQWRKVAYYLRLNRAKRRLILEPQVSASLWSRILSSGSADANILYYMLTRKPEIAFLG